MEKKFKVGNTTYKRSKLGVGKEIGGKLYIHKDYAEKYIPLYIECTELLPDGFHYNCICVDKKKPCTIRFDEAPDFDTAREPIVGDFIEVNLETKEIRKGHSNMIWHHKWMWVDDSYKGFDVNESYEWSKKWTKYITHPSGSKKIWKEQIKGIN